jgi:hypothetical protein
MLARCPDRSSVVVTGPWSRRAKAIAIALAISAAPVGVVAQERAASPWLTATAGYGQRVAVYGVGALWHLPWGEETLARYGLDARFGVDVLRWQGPAQGTANRFLWNGNLTPYLRWHPAEGVWHNTFIEVGVGIQALSSTSITSTADYRRNFGSAFQFGERLAAGVSFGPDGRYEIAPFVQHISNAKIKLPNDGLTYFGVTVRLALD